ncbi:MAG: glycosyltransferase family 39 protein [archaeon]
MRRGVVLLAIVLVLGFAARLEGISEPWAGGHHGYNGALYSTVARNYLRHGYLALGFAPVTDPVDMKKLYLHHPPMLGIMLSFVYSVFGVHEWAARLMMAVFSVANVALVFLIARRLYDNTAGLYASVFASFFPMSVFYGTMVDVQGSMAMFFILAMALSYLKWLGGKHIGWMIALFVLGSLVEWGIYYAVLFLVIDAMIENRVRFWGILVLPGVAVGMLMLFFAYTWVLTGSVSGGGLIGTAVQAVSGGVNGSGYERSFGIVDFIIREFQRIVSYFTWIGAGLFMAFLFMPSRKRSDRFALLMVLFGLSYVFLIINAAWVHDYNLYYLMPGLALASGRVMGSLHRQGRMAALCITGLFILMSIANVSEARKMHDGTLFFELGMYINENTEPGQTVMVSIDYHPEISYYADRTVVYGVRDRQGFAEGAVSYIAVQGDAGDGFFLGLLRDYPHSIHGPFLVFNVSAES